MPQNWTDPSINASEHTEENINAKRIAMYGWFPASLQWVRAQMDASGVFQTSAQLVASSLSIQSTVTVWQGGAPWLVNASVIGTPSVNVATAVTLSIGAMPAVSANVVSTTTTVFQGGAPWLVNASVQGTVPVSGTFWQANQPVTASLSGVPPVLASIQGVPNVLATVSPVGVYNSVIPSLVSLQSQQFQLDQHANLLVNVATVSAPITANASIQGTVPVSGTFWQANQPVTASVVGTPNVSATLVGVSNVIATVLQGSSPWTVTGSVGASQLGAPWTVNASIQGIINGIVTIANPSAAGGVTTVWQGGAPWAMLATVTPLGIYNSVIPSLVSLQTQQLQVDQHANLLVNIATVSSPLAVTATIGTPTVNQGTNPWLVSATIGVPSVLATLTGVSNVIATVVSMPAINASLVGISNVNASVIGVPNVIATVMQGTSPWLVNASVIGFGAVQQVVTASVIGVPSVNATIGPAIAAVMASTSNQSILVGEVNLGQYSSATQTIASSATLSYFPTQLDQNGNTKVVLVNSSATVTQGTNPWLVSATIGVPSVIATLVGIANVNASIIGVQNVIATVLQGTNPFLVNASVIGFGTVQQVVTASVIGQLPVTATVAAPLPVTATYASPWQVTATSAGGFVSPQADAGAIGSNSFINTSLVATCVTVKLGNTNLYGYHFYNSGAAVAFISLFAQTLATMGKTSATNILAVPANGWADGMGMGIPPTYTQALLVGASASINGTGNPAAPILANIWYK